MSYMHNVKISTACIIMFRFSHFLCREVYGSFKIVYGKSVRVFFGNRKRMHSSQWKTYYLL